MNNTQNTTIVLLLITAAILTTMLLPAFIGTEPAAYARGAVRQGKYIMATGAYDAKIDLLYIVNIESQKLCVYAPNITKRTIDKMGLALPLNKAAPAAKQ